MVHASEFTGIGGFDLAAQWMGWENRFQCEIDPFCLELLNQNFPNTKKHGDIRETNFTIYKRRIDVLSGGFPCQPYSTAGKRRGKADIRHLWPEMLRSVREFQPPYVVGENVRGLTNWNGGLVFDEVQADLEAEGYEVTPFLLPAAGIDAPHERYRIFFVAYNHLFNVNSRRFRSGILSQQQKTGIQQYNAYTDGNERCKGRMYQERCEEAKGHFGTPDSRTDRRGWKDFPTQSPVCRGVHGLSNRVDRIKALGNAVVPGVAYQIFKSIQQFDDQLIFGNEL